MTDPAGPAGAVDPVRAALGGCCPRCGKGKLFAGIIKFAAVCTNCGLDFSAFNVGDGPAAFLTLLIGVVVVFLAMWLELAAHPPWWVHLIVWTPVVVVTTMAALRFAKAALLALEYRNKAAEGRLDS